jgi:hypothetical protein
MVRVNETEAHGSEDRMKGLVPNSASLLKAIERLPESADIIWSAHLKYFRLLHVDLLLQGAVEKCMGDVHRVQVKVL